MPELPIPDPVPREGSPMHWAGSVTVVVTLGISCLPTVGTLGYPSALMLSPVFALFGARLGLRQLGAGRRIRGVSIGNLTTEALRRCALIWGVALSILALSSLLQGSLDLAFGSTCFLLGPILSTGLGWCSGIAAATIFDRRLARWTLAFGPFVASFGLTVWRLYRDPAVFAYDPFWGAWSGSIYDQDFEIGRTYLGYRAYNLAVGVGALALLAGGFVEREGRFRLSLLRARPLLIAGTLLLLAGAAFVGLQPAGFGFHQTARHLAEELNGRRETEHFVLHYRPDSPNAREIDALADEHEFWWMLLASRLSATPIAPIEVFLFDSPVDKRELIGVGAAEVAAPWRRQMYLQHHRDPHAVLPHELAHIFGAPFGDPVLGLAIDFPRVNAGLIEGFAVALAGAPVGHLDVHDRAAILAQLELTPRLESIFGWGFWATAPARAYDAAGSFCKWILERHGHQKLEALYREAGGFERILGQSLADLEHQWLEFLGKRTIDEQDVERQRLRFERGSLFERPHAYRVARLRRRVARALREGQVERALRLQADVACLEPEVLGHRLTWIRLLAARGRYEDASGALRPIFDDDALPTLLRSVAHEIEGDLALTLGENEAALRAYELAAALPLGESRQRTLALKRHAATDGAHFDIWRRYLRPFSVEADADAQSRLRIEAARELRGLPGERLLGSYLLARQYVNLYQLGRALPLLAECLWDRLPGQGWSLPELEISARELALIVTARLGYLDVAGDLLAEMRIDERGAGGRARNDQWEQRLEFLRSR